MGSGSTLTVWGWGCHKSFLSSIYLHSWCLWSNAVIRFSQWRAPTQRPMRTCSRDTTTTRCGSPTRESRNINRRRWKERDTLPTSMVGALTNRWKKLLPSLWDKSIKSIIAVERILIGRMTKNKSNLSVELGFPWVTLAPTFTTTNSRSILMMSSSLQWWEWPWRKNSERKSNRVSKWFLDTPMERRVDILSKQMKQLQVFMIMFGWTRTQMKSFT